MAVPCPSRDSTERTCLVIEGRDAHAHTIWCTKRTAQTALRQRLSPVPVWPHAQAAVTSVPSGLTALPLLHYDTTTHYYSTTVHVFTVPASQLQPRFPILSVDRYSNPADRRTNTRDKEAVAVPRDLYCNVTLGRGRVLSKPTRLEAAAGKFRALPAGGLFLNLNSRRRAEIDSTVLVLASWVRNRDDALVFFLLDLLCLDREVSMS